MTNIASVLLRAHFLGASNLVKAMPLREPDTVSACQYMEARDALIPARDRPRPAVPRIDLKVGLERCSTPTADGTILTVSPRTEVSHPYNLNDSPPRGSGAYSMRFSHKQSTPSRSVRLAPLVRAAATRQELRLRLLGADSRPAEFDTSLTQWSDLQRCVTQVSAEGESW